MKLNGWGWLLLIGIIYVAFTLGAMLGSEVIYIVEDIPTINNGWTGVLQEVYREDNESVPYQSEQTGIRLVRCSDHAYWRGT